MHEGGFTLSYNDLNNKNAGIESWEDNNGVPAMRVSSQIEENVNGNILKTKGLGLIGIDDFSNSITGDLEDDKKIYAQRSYVDKANSYSTEEIKTGGTWIDGKPIYRKIINTGVLNDEQYVSCNIDVYPEIETIASAKCICLRNITYQSLNIDNEVLQFNFDTQTSGLTVSGKSYVCLEYTKTTDVETIIGNFDLLL